MLGTTATHVADLRMSLGTVASLAAMIWSRTVLAESMRPCRSSFVEPAKAVDVSRKLRQTLAIAFFISMSFPFRRRDAAIVRIYPRFLRREEFCAAKKGSRPRLKPNQQGQRRNLSEQPTASAVNRALAVAEIR